MVQDYGTFVAICGQIAVFCAWFNNPLTDPLEICCSSALILKCCLLCLSVKIQPLPRDFKLARNCISV
jgi:hypothetical protein